MTLHKLYVTFLALTVSLFLAACSVEDPAAPSAGGNGANPNAPTANAGSNQTVTVGTTVTLDGRGSRDPQGDTLSYQWTFSSRPNGSNASLNGATTVQPTFTPDAAGSYVVQLIVNDGTNNSQPARVTITANALPPANRAPIANAGPNQSVSVGARVTLNGNGSSDPDGNTLTYSWTLSARPAGSSASLSSTTVVNPNFTADVAGNYTAQLIVNDGSLSSAPSTVTITAAVGNLPPVAVIAPVTGARVGTAVNLDGSGSSDPDNNPITYRWTLTGPSGSTATLANATSARPSFTPNVAGNYVVQLTVNDGSANSMPVSQTIAVAAQNRPPVANAGPAQTVSVGTRVTLNGTGSSDPDNNPLTYSWTLTTRPSGSNAALSGAMTAQPFFTPDVAGSYVAQLIVSDGTLSSTPASVAITANSATPSPVSCDSLKTEFLNVTWTQVLEPAVGGCLGCHQNLSVFRLVPSTTNGFNDTNFNTFRATAARNGGNNISLILTKAANLDNNHGGSQVIPPPPNSPKYDQLLDMVNKTRTCTTSTGPTQGVVNATGYNRLRKATLALGGRLPTAGEEAAVANAGTNETNVTNAINSSLDTLMNEPGFYIRLKEIYNDMLLTDYYAVGTRALGELDMSNFARRTYFDTNNLTGAGYNATDAGILRTRANYGLAKAPVELVAHVVRNNRPFTEIVTANYVMVNAYSAAIFGNTGAQAFTYGDALTAHDQNVFFPMQITDANSRTYEHAGILSTLPFLDRYPSTATNRNRARARYTFLFFLDTDVEGLADRAGLNLDAVTGQFPTLTDAQCTVCHNVVDPVAGLFKNWNNNGVFSGNVTNWFSARNPREMVDPGYTRTDVLPAAQSANALQFLGSRIASDGRFAVATVKTMLRGLMGPNAAEDAALVEQLRARFVASNYNMKSLVKEIVASNQFKAVNLGSNENPSNFATLGMPLISTPEQLHRKIIAVTGGYQWRSPGNRTLMDLTSYLLMYGGIDSMDVTERTREPTSIMTSIQERVAYQAACGAVPEDFARAQGSRALFPNVNITDLPDNGTGTTRIKQNIQYLHKRILGEELPVTDAEITRTYDLFVAVKNATSGSNIPADCNGTLAASDPVRVDANGTVRTWMAVVAYLMMDYKFVFE